MLERPTPLGADAVLALLRLLGFGAEHGYLDPSLHNAAGAALFVSGSPGAEASLLCQVRG